MLKSCNRLTPPSTPQLHVNTTTAQNNKLSLLPTVTVTHHAPAEPRSPRQQLPPRDTAALPTANTRQPQRVSVLSTSQHLNDDRITL